MKLKKCISAVLCAVLALPLCSVHAAELPTSYTTSAPPEGSVQFTPHSRTFRLPGYNNTFILLDDFSGGDSDRYIMCRDYYGMQQYSADKSQKFDAESNTLAKFLNGDFVSKGSGGTIIPKPVTDYINFSHEWVTEGGSKNKDCPSTYTSVMGIGILSAYEYKKYSGRFGTLDYDGYSKGACFTWWTRSGVNDSSGLMLVVSINKDGGTVGNLQSWGASGSTLLRPTFYLKADFFRNVKIDVFSAGETVLDMLRRDVSHSELAALYTDEEVKLIEKRTDAASVEIALGGAVNTVVSRSGGSINVTAEGLSDGGVLHCTLTDINGNESFLSSPIANGKNSVPLAALKNGIYNADIYVECGGGICGYLGTQITVASEPRNFSDSSYYMKGFNSVSEDALPLLKRMGAGWVRAGLAWESVEKSEGKYSFERFDERFAQLEQNGINVYFSLQGANPLYTDGNGSKCISTDYQIEKFTEYALAVAAHYPQIKYFEISNEPNDGTYVFSAESYGKLLESCAAALKEFNPEIRVIGGAIAPIGNKYTYLPEALKNISIDNVDGFSYHPYIHTRGNADSFFTDEISGFADSLKQLGAWKGLYISEIGFPTYTGSLGISEAKQAEELVKQAVYSNISGYKSNLIYNFTESGLMKSNGEHTFGIVRKTSLEPKPAYVTMLEYFNRTDKYIGTLDFGAGIMAALYSSGDGLTAVLWSTDGGEHSVPIEGRAMFDIYGNSFSGSVLPSSPVYICGVSEDYLEVCAKAAINVAYEDIEKNYSLPQTVLQTAERNKSETDAFERLRGNYNIGNLLISEYRRGKTALGEADILNILKKLHSVGQTLSECCVRSDSETPGSSYLNGSICISGICEPHTPVGIFVPREDGAAYYMDQTFSDANGNYAFAFPESEDMGGTYAIRTSSGGAQTSERIFALSSQLLPKNTIVESASKDCGIFAQIADEAARLSEISGSAAAQWQAYFLSKWLCDAADSVCLTSVSNVGGKLSLTFSNYENTAVTGSVIIGGYGESGSLGAVSAQQRITLPPRGTASLTVPLPSESSERLFFWKDVKTLIPIINPVELKRGC